MDLHEEDREAAKAELDSEQKASRSLDFIRFWELQLQERVRTSLAVATKPVVSRPTPQPRVLFG